MTTFAETFTGSDTSLGPDLTWSDILGDWHRSSGVAEFGDAQGTAGVLCRARAEHDSDTPDMFVETTVKARTGSYVDVRLGARYSGVADTGYELIWDNNGGPNLSIFRNIAGAGTQIGVSETVSYAPNDVIKMEVSGTGATVTITVYKNGVQVHQVTDTSGSRLVSGTRGMVGGYGAGGTVLVQLDDYTHGDIVVNTGPTANAGADQVVLTSDLVVLDGTASTDDVGITSWSWTQVSGTAVTINDANTATASFDAPGVVGDLVFELEVEDVDAEVDTDQVTIHIALPAPVGISYTLTEMDSVAESIDVSRGAVVEGDSVYVLLAINSTGLITTPPADQGWVLVQKTVKESGVATGEVWWKVAGPTEPLTYEFRLGTWRIAIATCVVLRGAANPDLTADAVGFGANAVTPEVIVDAYNSMLLLNITVPGSSDIPITPPDGTYDERSDHNAVDSDSTIGQATYTKLMPDGLTGTETSKNFLLSQSSNWIAQILVIEPGTPNSVPWVDAGEDITVVVGDLVAFESTATDLDGTIVAHEWTAPVGVSLSATNVANPTWDTTGVAFGTYEFSYRAQDDGGVWSEPETVLITVAAAFEVKVWTGTEWSNSGEVMLKARVSGVWEDLG